MKEYLAYIDESGDPIFKDGASETLFLGAIVIAKEDYPHIKEELKRIKRKNNVSVLKSSRISDFKKRIKICEELSRLKIKILSILVDKNQLVGDWFKYRANFYKYVQRLLNHEIYMLFDTVRVQIDRYGSSEYIKSLDEYLKRSLQLELFEPQIEISSAKVQEFIQIADFLSGSLRKSIEGDFGKDESIQNALKPIWIIRQSIPDYGKYVKPIPSDESLHEISVCLEEARRYLEKNTGLVDDPKIKTLEYLYHSGLDEPNEYIYTAEILSWLTEFGIKLSEEQFRTEVTAALRDEGLIIVGTRRGYKIPTTIDDFREYVAFSVNLALPMLKRLKKAINFMEAREDSLKIRQLLSDEMEHILRNVNV
jgi:hypothetical protein